MKSKLNRLRALADRQYVKAGAAFSMAVASGASFAAVDLEGVETAITANVASGETVGGYIIAGVAALAVVGVIIALVRKL